MNQPRKSKLASARLASLVAAGAFLWCAAVNAQQAFPTPDAASEAFVDALARHDSDAMKTVLGPEYSKFIPSKGVDPHSITDFLAAWAEQHKTVTTGDTAVLGVGKSGWQLPIPMRKSAAGWRFDIAATPDELRTRRIGRNELAVIQSMLAYYDAQKEYAQVDHDGDGVPQYAERIMSRPGKQDGLYWATQPGAPESQLGPRFADVRPGEAYHGYHYKILTAQGPSAPGGAFNYVVAKRMTGGFAAVAWPAVYGDTGVMSFMVNYRGDVYQKDLGPNSGTIAKAITTFNPDAGWTLVKP